MKRTLIAALAAGGLFACGEGTRGLARCDGHGEAPRCVAQLQGPCGDWSETAAECVADGWRCPEGAKQHVAALGADSCTLSTIEGPVGAPISVGDQCVWPLDGGGRAKIGRAIEDGPFGACPSLSSVATALLDATALAEDRWVDVMDSVETGGRSISFYRLFALDENELFGLRGLFGDVAAHDAFGRIRPQEARLFADDWYRSVIADGEWLYVYECGGEPRFLSFGCLLKRVRPDDANDPSAYEQVGGEIFEAGPHFSVRWHAGIERWVLTTIGGFGDMIEIRTAAKPEGPWSEATRIASCELPSDDPDAFCDGARAHPNLRDPFDPTQIVISYRIATLAQDREQRIRRNPDAYASRLVFTNVR